MIQGPPFRIALSFQNLVATIARMINPGIRRSSRLARTPAVRTADANSRRKVSAAAPNEDCENRQPRHKRQRKEQAEPPTTTSADAKAAAASVATDAGPVTGPSRSYEHELWEQGYARVAGVDEAGRGPLAGPVVAAACIIPSTVHIPGVNDSKKVVEQQREAIYKQLTSHPEIIWAVQVVEAEEIDRINILQAAMKAMEGAVAALTPTPDFVLVDGNRLPKALDPERSKFIIKGDTKCYAIAAASIIAKVTRDRLMAALDVQFPVYGFGQHKGYGVPSHLAAIRAHGPCPQHRRSFKPIRTDYPDPNA